MSEPCHIHPAAGNHAARKAQDQPTDSQWECLLADLWACRDQQQTWGNIDEVAIARYLSGECSEPERREIERAIEHSPELGECIALIQEAFDELDDMESAA